MQLSKKEQISPNTASLSVPSPTLRGPDDQIDSTNGFIVHIYRCMGVQILRILRECKVQNISSLLWCWVYGGGGGQSIRFVIFRMEQDIIIKFCVVGEPSVGKTSMLYQYVHHKFDEKVRPTIGCDFSTKLKSSVDGKAVRLQLWDIAGQERFNAVSKMYLRGALGCIVVCSSQDPATIEWTIKWKNIIQENADYGSETAIPCLLVQNKSDLINNENPQTHQTKKFLEEFARTNGFCAAMQCSAKEDKNIEEIFQALLDEAIRRKLVKSSPQIGIRSTDTRPQQQENIVLTNSRSPNSSKQEKSKCC